MATFHEPNWLIALARKRAEVGYIAPALARVSYRGYEPEYHG